MNQADITVADLKVRPEALAELVGLVAAGEINQSTGKICTGRDVPVWEERGGDRRGARA